GRGGAGGASRAPQCLSPGIQPSECLKIWPARIEAREGNPFQRARSATQMCVLRLQCGGRSVVAGRSWVDMMTPKIPGLALSRSLVDPAAIAADQHSTRQESLRSDLHTFRSQTHRDRASLWRAE